MRTIIILFLLFLVVGCAKSPVSPDWLTAEPADYPAARFLNGRGQGETAGLARDRARADLAKVFEVAVRESSSDSLQWLQGSVGKDELQTSISRDIHLQTSQIVNGVEIAQTWRGEKGGDYYALAVLDRLQAGNRLRAEIAALDAETAQSIAHARSQDALPEKISAAYNALYAQLQRRHPQKMLRIVDGTGLGVPPKYSLAELKGDFETLLDRWQIGLEVGKDELGGASDLLSGALGNAGIRHLAGGNQAEYLLKADLDSDKFTAGNGWNWVRGTLRVSLLETASGNVIGSHQWSYKSSALQPATAEIRARDQLADLLARDLLKVLVDLGDVAENR